MKRLIISFFLVLLVASVAMATWITDFQDNYDSSGIDKAVVYALEDGATPDAIVANGLQLDGLNPQNLIMALYCAGANGEDIRAAAKHWEISREVIAAGYKKAIEECDNVIVDSQAYTEAPGKVAASSSLSTGSTGFASPATF